MHAPLKAVVAVAFLASLPIQMRANPQNASGAALTEKTVKAAESEAKTSADHTRLAVYYQSKAQSTREKLADAEDLMKHYSFMEGRTKVPNAYTSARTLVDRYRAELEQDNKLAADHRKTAESLEASAAK